MTTWLGALSPIWSVHVVYYPSLYHFVNSIMLLYYLCYWSLVFNKDCMNHILSFPVLCFLNSFMHFITSAFPFETQGPHLLAPTGSDLRRYGQEGTVFAGYHYDLNFLTIHGRSRFPGLNIWLRNGQKVEVKVPVGCLLIQTGKQVRVMTNVWCLCSWANLLHKSSGFIGKAITNMIQEFIGFAHIQCPDDGRNNLIVDIFIWTS